MKKERKQASLFDALLCLGFLVTVLVTSLVFLKEYEISAHIPLLVGGIFTAGIAIFKLGFTWKELEEGILYNKYNNAINSYPINCWCFNRYLDYIRNRS